MTPVEQPNPEWDALLDRVRTQVRDCNLQEAILVDDNLDTGLTEERWIRAVEQLRGDDAVAFGKLRALIGEKGTGNIDELPPEDIQPEAVSLIHASTSRGASAIVNEVRFREPALERLASILSEIGLKPSFHTQVTPESPLRTGKLYFLDYRMQGDDATAGMDASNLLSDIVQRPGDAPPPAAVLMSRGQNQRPTQADWELVARRAGYYRFNFRYLEKEKLDAGRMSFLFFLHELLAALPLGAEYYSQLKKLKSAADAAAEAALAKIRQLSPAEFSIFAGRHLGDGSGRKATRHVLELYLGLLDAEVKDNADLEASFRAFAQMLRSSPMLATTDTDIHTFHEMHNRLLYDRSRWVLSGPVEFGDIFHRGIEPDIYYMVLTPECDLELRYRKDSNAWAPKADDVLLLRGEVKEKEPDKTREDIVVKPFVSEGAPRWICWLLRKRMIVPTHTLMDEPSEQAVDVQQSATGAVVTQPHDANERWKKWGRLRQLDAEQIQQEFVSDFASVGTEEISGNINLVKIEVWQRQPERQLGNIVIVETNNPNDDKMSPSAPN